MEGVTDIFSPKRDYTVRPMLREEIALVVEWAAREGWNPGRFDADSFFAADPEGFLVGVLGDEPVATISAVRYGESFAFLGFYIVKPEFRGMGYGFRLWEAALARLEGRTIGLDGVLAQEENYRRSGFELAYRNVRFQGRGGAAIIPHSAIVPLKECSFEAVEKYDGAFFPAGRTAFLRSWLAQPDAFALGIRSEGGLGGYGVMRPCRDGYKIGPLFADNGVLAEALFTALCAQVGEAVPVFLDVPEPNEEALALVQKYGLVRVFETARMYKGEVPQLPLDRLFGVTSFELG